MSRFLSDFPTQADRGRPFRSACLTCRRRRDCPYACDPAEEEPLDYAARQGEAAARRLTAEAGHLLAELSRAGCAGRLLQADDAVERALADVLRTEVSLIAALGKSAE